MVRLGFIRPEEGPAVFPPLTSGSGNLLEQFPSIVQEVMPLDSKKRRQLNDDIRQLSRSLTDERNTRRVGYMNDPSVLSAYIRYYMWWNLVRLVRLFTSLPLELEDGDFALDLGSGPLTLPVALWIARPDLRDKKISWYCVDVSQNALSAGEEIFLHFAARTGNTPWHITRVKGEAGVPLHRKVRFAASANMFNELFWNNPRSLERQIQLYAGIIENYVQPQASVLLVEPGIPAAGRFISLMREALGRLDFLPVFPCPHTELCPLAGKNSRKWCHFVFDTASAPAQLHKLSGDSGLSKDRAALTFLYAARDPDDRPEKRKRRIREKAGTPERF
ncbi:hypothetical protein K7I13_07750 [Brucepastera parasyntrophica]|uniref:small ribosomal subunit Rsm22 family protein n=1 Tax=Brucepastera parasyntrophica TaxID=2880008 RepID=UPI00210A5A4C|nr:small ribosomal subunit Rsm22 family protein [Brucepastera parasyntrophica]ULQ58471.1 hypothetical protein K7I13_07750 [Brucepastera parasyntrophica]